MTIKIGVMDKEHKNMTTKDNSRLKRLVLGVLISLAVVYSGIWYFISRSIETHIEDAIVQMRTKGLHVNCDPMRKTGYPLKVGIACDDFYWQSPLQGMSFSSPKLVADAPIYAPHWLEVTAKSPVNAEFPDILPVIANWKRMSLKADIASKIPDSIDLSLEDFDFQLKDEQGFNPISGDFIRLQMNGLHEDMQLLANFSELRLPFVTAWDGNIDNTVLNGSISASLQNSGQIFNDSKKTFRLSDLRGQSGEIEQANINVSDGGGIRLTGKYAFTSDGYLDAQFKLSILQLQDFMRMLAYQFPHQAENMRSYQFVLMSMPKDSEGNPVIGLNIEHGKIRLGFLQVGRIPPI